MDLRNIEHDANGVSDWSALLESAAGTNAKASEAFTAGRRVIGRPETRHRVGREQAGLGIERLQMPLEGPRLWIKQRLNPNGIGIVGITTRPGPALQERGLATGERLRPQLRLHRLPRHTARIAQLEVGSVMDRVLPRFSVNCPELPPVIMVMRCSTARQSRSNQWSLFPERDRCLGETQRSG